MKNNIPEQMKTIQVRNLTETESAQVWQAIHERLPARAGNKFLFPLLFKPKFMLGIFIAVVLVLSGAFTVRAADNAKPGDWLFPLDRTLESVSVKFVPHSQRDELKIKYAQERVGEVNSLITARDKKIKEQEVLPDSGSRVSDSGVDLASGRLLSEEEVRLEQAFQTAFDYITAVQKDLSSEDERVIDLLNQLLSQVKYQAGSIPQGLKLEMELENGDTKAEIKFMPNKTKIESQPGQSSEQPIDVKLKQVGQAEQKVEIEGFTTTGKVHYKVADDDKVEIEYESSKTDDGGKIFIPYGDDGIEIEGGKIFIPYGDDGIEIEGGSDDSYSGVVNDDSGQVNIRLQEIKVKVKGDQAEIKVDFVGGEHEFTLVYNDRDGLIKQLADKYKADVNLVKSIVEIEFESD